ncbi:MAG: hypothetical protein K5Q00_02260 [Gammaproteobacteria bacterium]|nr:hypothetical protein [Gammaproteobacteria bacterium]
MGAFSLGVGAYRNNQYEAAIGYFNRALNERSCRIAVLFWRGLTYHRLGQETQNHRAQRNYYVMAANDYCEVISLALLYPNFARDAANAQRNLNELSRLGIEPQNFLSRTWRHHHWSCHARQ